MCEFISWIEKGNAVLFLTGEDVFHTKKGKELQKYCGSNRDYTGHGAIGYFYANEDGKLMRGGTENGCTDFSTPDNFPPEIVKAIKLGQMRGLGIAPQLLTKPAWAEYDKVKQTAWAEYEKVKQTAFWDLFKVKKNRVEAWR
jgi:hypothetical protein